LPLDNESEIDPANQPVLHDDDDEIICVDEENKSNDEVLIV